MPNGTGFTLVPLVFLLAIIFLREDSGWFPERAGCLHYCNVNRPVSNHLLAFNHPNAATIASRRHNSVTASVAAVRGFKLVPKHEKLFAYERS